MITHLHSFTRDNGQPVIVEYSVTSGEPDFDGGGSGPNVMIVSAWPNDRYHDWLASVSLRLMTGSNRTAAGWWLACLLRRPIDWLMQLDVWWRASLTDGECERIEQWIAERTYFDDDYYEDNYA